MEKVRVEVEKFKAKDGRVFDKQEDCILHEKRIDGLVKTCPGCDGNKVVDPYGDGRTQSTCNQCKGKGYVERVEKWE